MPGKGKYLLFTLLSTFILSSCLTMQPKPFDYDSATTDIYETDTAAYTLTPIPEEELVSQFGSKGNIFAEYPAKLTKKRLIVYKLEINSSTATGYIDLRNIILSIDGVSSQSKYRNLLLESWSTYLRTDNEIARAENLARSYMFNNKITLTHSSSQSGLIVFLKDFPEEGERSLKIGLTMEDDSIEEIIIPLTHNNLQ